MNERAAVVTNHSLIALVVGAIALALPPLIVWARRPKPPAESSRVVADPPQPHSARPHTPGAGRGGEQGGQGEGEWPGMDLDDDDDDGLDSESVRTPATDSKVVMPKLPVSLLQVREEFGGKPKDWLDRQRRLAEAHAACHEIRPGLFLAADPVARDHALLQAHAITHVLNAAGAVCANHHEHHASHPLQYLALSLADGPGQELVCCVYPALAFIERALGDGGRVLVHCWQGVSRSSSLVIAWLMANEGLGFDAALAVVREKRGVARPNAGFAFQLREWGQRLKGNFAGSLVYKITPLPDSTPPMLVALPQHKPTRHCLDDDACVVVHTATDGQLFLWVGKDAPADKRQCAHDHCHNLRRYEHATGTTVVLQGEETEGFWRALDAAGQ